LFSNCLVAVHLHNNSSEIFSFPALATCRRTRRRRWALSGSYPGTQPNKRCRDSLNLWV